MLNSQRLFAQAQLLIPGGVNSPVRAFTQVDGVPIFFKSGSGAYLIDVDDKKYIDYVCSWGPLILGHCHKSVIAAMSEVIHTGVSFGAPSTFEIDLSQKIIARMPSIEQIRMVNSGTEATMTALRLARGYTNRHKIIKFDGCYHGHNDALLVKSGSGVATIGVPSTSGIPPNVTEHTLVAEFNNAAHVGELFEQFPEQIAAIIVEPIAGNMNMILPAAGFLQSLRELCNQYGAVLIFDEVMTGFRVAAGGAQAIYNVKPDLTTLGKVIGGGLPVGAVGGKKEIMSFLAPQGPIYQAGTLSGNCLAMAAGLATLTATEAPGFYANLDILSKELINGLQVISSSYKIPFCGNAMAGLFGFCFGNTLNNYKDICTVDWQLFKKFYHEMLKEGIYFAPSMFESGFISSAHTKNDIQTTLEIADKFFDKLVHGE